MSDEALNALAGKAGLELQWVDAKGDSHVVPAETLRSVLAALGLPADSAAQIALSDAQLEEQSRLAPPLLTAWTGETISVGGQALTAPDSPGYYPVEINGVAKMLAAAPRHCFGIADVSDRRLAGLGVQLYSLRGGHTAGFGDFAAVGEFAQQAAARGIDAVGLSPTHALFPADLTRISPYSASSRLFLNPLFADAGLWGGDVAADNRADGLIDWQTAGAEKFAALRGSYQAFLTHGDRDKFRAFCAEGGERLLRHAIFEVLDAHFRTQNLSTWRAWPGDYRDASNVAVAEFAREHADEVDYRRFLQFLTAKSADAAQARAREAGMTVGLISDIATGIDPNGSDSWAAPEDVLMGLGIGAPPDPFNSAGQGWGLTALSPTALRNKGCGTFIAMLRANMAHTGGVRIDHVMSLMRLWVIPDGAPPTQGVYLRYPMEDLLRLVALESHRNRAIVIGEDLGTVPFGFRDVLAYRRIAGMQVLWFARDWGNFIPPAHWRTDAVAMTSTHDLPTIAGWWRERDIDWRAELGMYRGESEAASERRMRGEDRRALWSALQQAGRAHGEIPPPDYPEPVVSGAIAYVGSTPSQLAMVPIEDVCALPEQPNLPGTIDEHPNWRRRLPPGELFAVPGAESRLAEFVRARRG
jgi:4-alpha-glucanotransferase